MAEHGDEVDLDAEVAELRAVRDADPTAAPTGALGRALLARFERDERPADLSEALALLESAVAADPSAEDAPFWRYSLGSAYEYRAETSGDLADLDTAIRWMTQALDDVSADPGAVAGVAPELGLLHWRRFLALDPPSDAAEFDASDRLVRALAALPPIDASPADRDYVAMLAGLAHLQRYRAGGLPADLEEGVRTLDAALPALPPDVPLLAEAWYDLSEVCWDVYHRDDDPSWLDRAVAAAGSATAAVRADDPSSTAYFRQELACREARWRLGQGRADLDRAITCVRRVIAEDEADAWLLFGCGDLLRERGDLDASVDDLTEAIRWLEKAVAQAAPDDEDLWEYHFTLAATRLREAELTGCAADDSAVAVGLGAALRAGIPDPDLEFPAHLERLGAAYRWAEGTRGDRTALAEARAAVTDADAALDRLEEADPDQAAGLAGILLPAMFWIAGHDLGRWTRTGSAACSPSPAGYRTNRRPGNPSST